MIEGLPFYVTAVFFLTTLLTVWFLFRAMKDVGTRSTGAKLLVFCLPLWMLLTGFLATTDFYRDTEAMPPRVFSVGVLPALILIVSLWVFFRESFIDRLSLKYLTLLHSIRIPVELVLLWLFQYGQVPKVMTFEGWNFDIFSGVTAIIVYFLAFRSKKIYRTLLLIWNLVGLGLLVNIVSIAVLSFRSPMQKLAFDQPNVGVTYLPFIWLPTIIVPIVFFAHLASIRKLLRNSPEMNK